MITMRHSHCFSNPAIDLAYAMDQMTAEHFPALYKLYPSEDPITLAVALSNIIEAAAANELEECAVTDIAFAAADDLLNLTHHCGRDTYNARQVAMAACTLEGVLDYAPVPAPAETAWAYEYIQRLSDMVSTLAPTA